MKNLLPLLLLAAAANTSLFAVTALPTNIFDFNSGNGNDVNGVINLSGNNLASGSGMWGSDGVNSGGTSGNVYKAPTDSSDPGTYSPLTQPGTDDFSLTFWYKTSANPAKESFLVFQGGRWANDGGHTAGYALALKNDGQIFLYAGVHNVTSNRIVSMGSGTSITTDAWNFVSMVRRGTVMELYLNGVLANSVSIPSGADISVDNAAGQWYREFGIGYSSNTGTDTNTVGSVIDEVGIWKGDALTALDIAEIYNGGSGLALTSLTLVPEPSTYALIGGLSVMGLALATRRRRR